LYAEFYLHYDVDYTDFPGHVGQGQGRLSERFRPADTPAPVNKRAMVGPNLLVMPRGPQMVSAGQSVPDASIRTEMFSSIATVVTQLHDISSDRCSRYMLRSRGTAPTFASSSAPVHDDYGVVDLPSSVDISAIVEVDALQRLSSCLSSDLLDAYRAVSTLTGIPLRDMTSQIIRHILSRTAVPEDSQRQEDILAPSTAPAATEAQATAPAATEAQATAPAATEAQATAHVATEAQATTPAATEAQTTAPAPATEDPTAPLPTQDVSARHRGLFTSMLSDQGRAIQLDIDTTFSLHDSDISQIGRALHDATVNF
jgi:hypothetical protein